MALRNRKTAGSTRIAQEDLRGSNTPTTQTYWRNKANRNKHARRSPEVIGDRRRTGPLTGDAAYDLGKCLPVRRRSPSGGVDPLEWVELSGAM